MRQADSALSAQLPSQVGDSQGSGASLNDDTVTGDGSSRIIAASYSRFSSDLQDEASTERQKVRTREAAVKNHHFLPSHLEFVDEAVSGTVASRTGLDAMMEAARTKKFEVLYVHSLSRIARGMAIAIPLLRKLVVKHGVRIISVSEGLDSIHKGWKVVSTFQSMMHEQYIEILSDQVISGFENNLRHDLSIGDYVLGYCSEVIPGQEGTTRFKQGKPRKRVVIDEVAAQIVRKIFHWFVYELRSMNWIRKELNRMHAPTDHRSKRKTWQNGPVRTVLSNPKYIGQWQWGTRKNIRDPLTGDVEQKRRPPEETAKWLRVCPELRIIDDETFFLAQKRLAQILEKFSVMRKKLGQFHGSCRDLANPRHLLQGIIRCAQCGSTFQQNGLGGPYLQCSGYRRGECTVKTGLPRQLAERMILDAISHRLVNNDAWMHQLLASVQKTWQANQKDRPEERKRLERQLIETKQRIANLLDQVEAGDAPADLNLRLRQRRQEAGGLEQQLIGLAESEPEQCAPCEAWIRQRLQNLHDLLASEPSRAGVALRQLIGQVTVRATEHRGLIRKKFIGSFSLSNATAAQAINSGVSSDDRHSEMIELLFADPPPWAEWADRIKEGYDRGLRYEDIAEELNCKYGWIALGLQWWHESRGLPVPKGNDKRPRPKLKPIASKIVDEAKVLWDQGMKLAEIAARLSCDKGTLLVALQKWFADRGLPYPDGRTRRKQLRLRRKEMNQSPEQNHLDPGERCPKDRLAAAS
jgi:site-specific DNA recombinase